MLTHGAQVQGLLDLAHGAGVPKSAARPVIPSGIDFVLEGLYAQKKISRSDERGYHAADQPVRRPSRETIASDETPMPSAGGKKKYYN